MKGYWGILQDGINRPVCHDILGWMLCNMVYCFVFLGLAHSAVAATPDVDALIQKGGQAVLEFSDSVANPYPDRTMLVEMRIEGGGR